MSGTINCPKCEYEHAPSGSHEDDIGERTCDNCGFKFHVEIDYDPDYSTSCVKCEFNEDWKKVIHRGQERKICHCVNCQAAKFKP